MENENNTEQAEETTTKLAGPVMIPVASGKGGVGKTFVTANLAIEGGAAADRVTVCHQHVSLEEFNPAKAEASRTVLRAEWGLADEDVAFLFVAHNLRLKNLELLRQVFGELNLPNAKLVVVGKRHPRWEAPWLVFAGEACEMAAVYGAGDALLACGRMRALRLLLLQC